MAKFMLIAHETPGGFSKLSPSEIQSVIEKCQSWGNKLRAAGRVVNGDKLREEGGKVVTLRNGKFSVVDGPYAETKEVVGGYLTIRAENYDEAIELVRDCPHLAFGRLEVRQIDPTGCGGE